MSTYRFCDIALVSDLELPELVPGEAGLTTCRVRCVPRRREQAPPEWFHRWHWPDGTLWCSFARAPGGYLARFAELADFHIAADGREVHCTPVAGVPEATVRHLLLNQVMPLALARSGRLVLHASAVAVGGRGVAFAGVTGRGKSTLAAVLVRDGGALLTDDCLVVAEVEGRFLAVPSYPALRLWEDAYLAIWPRGEVQAERVAHYTSKQRVVAGSRQLAFHDAPVPLETLYLPDPGALVPQDGGPQRELLRGREAFMALVACAHRLDIHDSLELQSGFAMLGRLVKGCPVYRLRYAMDLSHLPRVGEAVRRAHAVGT